MRYLLVAAALGLVLALFAPARWAPARAADEPVVFVSQVRDVDLGFEGEGTLTPESEQVLTVSDEIGSSQIEEIIEEGQHVAKGDVVARLSTYRISVEEREARRELVAKQAERDRLLSDSQTTGADEKLKTATQAADLQYRRRELAFLESGPDSRKLESLDLKVQRARVDEDYLAGKVRTQEALKGKGYLSELEYESAVTDLAKAHLDREKQENLIASQKEGPLATEREKSRTQVQKVERDLDLATKAARSAEAIRTLGVEKKLAEIQDKETAVATRERLRESAVLRAPLEGTVLYPSDMWGGGELQEGSTVWGGMALVRVVRRGRLHAKVQVNERWISRIRVGQVAAVYGAHQTAAQPARVTAISRLARQRDDAPKSPRDFTVELVLDGDAPDLAPNMTCRAVITVAHLAAVSRLPVDLVRSRAGDTLALEALAGAARVPVTAHRVDEDADFVYAQGVPVGTRLVY